MTSNLFWEAAQISDGHKALDYPSEISWKTHFKWHDNGFFLTGSSHHAFVEGIWMVFFELKESGPGFVWRRPGPNPQKSNAWRAWVLFHHLRHSNAEATNQTTQILTPLSKPEISSILNFLQQALLEWHITCLTSPTKALLHLIGVLVNDRTNEKSEDKQSENAI